MPIRVTGHRSPVTGLVMDDRLKKRIMMFYFAGAINAFLGVYVVFEGRNFLPPETMRWLALFFFGFAAVDFWFPRMIKRKWREAQAKLNAQREQQKA